MKNSKSFIIASSPHIHHTQSNHTLVGSVIICLLPATIWGLALYGLSACFVLAASLATAIIIELVIGFFLKRFVFFDGTALLTALLIGISLPANVPLYIPIASVAFALLVVKWTFGGSGTNWMNPALAGLVFSYLAWPESVRVWIQPNLLSGVQGISGATPLSTGMSALGSGTQAGAHFTAFLNQNIFQYLGAELPLGYADLLLGNRSGAIGEAAILLLLLGAAVLIILNIIRFEIPLIYVGTVLILSFIFGAGFSSESGALFEGDALGALLSGSLVLCAFFMATDPVTSPEHTASRIIYAVFAGLLTWIFRRFASWSEGTAFAVLIANCFVPLIDSYFSKLNFKRRFAV